MTNPGNSVTPPLANQVHAPSQPDFPVVGIGASAGGMVALLNLFEHMPVSHDMAFVVILHLSPTHPSSAGSILQRSTRMPVVQVTTKVKIEPRHVYVIAPNYQLSMFDSMLVVSELERPRGKHVAIDLFFRTLAEVHRERAIAIVLSGTGSDGAVGLSRIKENGGLTLVQAPDDAEYEGMPQSAIHTKAVDFILPVVDIPQKLIELWDNARIIELPLPDDGEAPIARIPGPAEAAVAEEALQQIIAQLFSHSGHDFRHYKRATVLRRIERRLQVRAVHSLPEYSEVLEADPDEFKSLLDDMLIGVTNFFRDREAFEALERDVMPNLFKDKAPGDEVRAWVAACASGEEAYSLAIMMTEQAALNDAAPPFQVFASDIDEHAIHTARAGTYSGAIVTDVAPARLRQYFTKEDERYRIRKTVRDRVLFASHNLLRDPPFSRLDLITCRNLLIYLNRDVQAKILQMFHFALKPGGYLFLGSSESADAVADYFIPIDKKNRIYRARSGIPQVQYQSPGRVGFGARVPENTRSKTPLKRAFSYSALHQRALVQIAPPSAVIDREGNIVHMSEHAGQFLRMIGGEPSRNLLQLILPELRLELRSALYQVTQGDTTINCRPIKLSSESAPGPIAITLQPFRDDEAENDFVLVLFKQADEPSGPPAETRPSGSHEVVLAQLEAELQRRREQLQETIESSEVSNEELRASNEELQAINEELRSATEELETSKEELQSVNEELITVNYELKVKVEETGKANDDLNNLIASTDIATIFVDSGMRIKRFTPRATDLFSIIASDVGRSLLDLTHKLDYEHLPEDVNATFETLRLVEREVRSIEGRCYIARLLPYRTNEDRIEGAVMTFFDVTLRRQAQDQARASEARMRLVAESASDYSIITLDAEGRVTSWSKGAENLFGYNAQEMAEQTLERLFTPEDIASGVPANELRCARANGRAEDERWHVRKDGSRFYCSGVTTPLADSSFYGYAKISQDATARLHHEAEREQALGREQTIRSEAQQDSALREEFLSVMAHELRNPLNMININVELLSRMPVVREAPGFPRIATGIRNAVTSQAKIIDDLMDMSRIRTGKLSLAKVQIDIGRVVRELIDTVRAGNAASEVTIGFTDHGEGAIVFADQVRIEQVVMNLLSNAMKFTPAGGTVDVLIVREDASVRLDVTDNGQGIAPEFLPRVFDMYGQSAAAIQRANGGLGIGLALVCDIMKLHDGRVEAFSGGVGEGARFSVWLPVAEPAESSPQHHQRSMDEALAGRRILLIDPVRDTLETFTSLLELSGATVFAGVSANEGLRILGQERIDLLIADISTNSADGLGLMRQMRAHKLFAGLPAIALSSMHREDDVAAVIAAGFSVQLGKPISLETLSVTIRQLLPEQS
jgi:two-component system CheB/CheR fusion protein